MDAAEVAAERRHEEELQELKKLLDAATKGGAANQAAAKELAQLRAELAAKEAQQREIDAQRYESNKNRKQQEAQFISSFCNNSPRRRNTHSRSAKKQRLRE
jgi:pyocin large subunit-like protein